MSVRQNIAAVPGITVGHATLDAHGTGCTVILGPESGMRAAACVRGRATGTREIDALDPRHLVERIDAVLITGGSAHGLGAADGVMRWLRERGRGLPVGPVTVPIVPQRSSSTSATPANRSAGLGPTTRIAHASKRMRMWLKEGSALVPARPAAKRRVSTR